jgi:6-pyruvoyltetrahydropterin/6-carboxytetrahydropterin synthase
MAPKMNVTLVKKMTFAAGHRLYNPAFDDQKNLEVFGPCSNPNGHGHNYTLEVYVTGEMKETTGMVINLKELKAIIDREIIAKVDHKNLNTDVDFMQGVIPTTENLATRIFQILKAKLPAGMLTKITIQETDNNRVEVTDT